MILDRTTGFKTRVNLFIIYQMYYKTKKAPSFMVPGKSRRGIAKDLGEKIGISRQKLFGIFRGDRYSMNDAKAQKIADLFDINADYFGKDSELIKIHEITENDWRCFFQQRNPSSVDHVTKFQDELKNGEKKVKEGLKEITDFEYVANYYATESPVYRISYYLTNGMTYHGTGRIDNFLHALEALDITDWKGLIDDKKVLIDDKKKYMELMKRHYEYANAYFKYKELEGKL